VVAEVTVIISKEVEVEAVAAVEATVIISKEVEAVAAVEVTVMINKEVVWEEAEAEAEAWISLAAWETNSLEVGINHSLTY
jgi:hypothetical protein